METVGVQVQTFCITIAIGAAIGLLFDSYQLLRGVGRPRMIFTHVGDLLFWLIATLLAFGILLLSNWGEVRFYVFIGMAMGLASYFRWLSRPVTAVMKSIARICVKLTRTLFRVVHIVVVQPIVFCLTIIAWPFRFVGVKVARTINKLWQWCKEHTKINPPPPEN